MVKRKRIPSSATLVVTSLASKRENDSTELDSDINHIETDNSRSLKNSENSNEFSNITNSLVWIIDDETGYTLASVIGEEDGSDSDDSTRIKVKVISDGQIKLIHHGECYPLNPKSQDGIPDNTSLMHLHEPGLLHNVSSRYSKNLFYTYIGYILIAVNPYKQQSGMYSINKIKEYHGKSIGILDPHPFAIADRAYRSMLHGKRSQNIIVSGESGSGKTETSKILMKFLSEIGSENTVVKESDTIGFHTPNVSSRLLAANPILEAFGNAKTLKNNNSSRFGKFTEIYFDENGIVSFAKLSTFLLEKSRVVHLTKGERNFHIFYMLVHGIESNSLKEELCLNNVSSKDFSYLNQSTCYSISGLNEKSSYDSLINSFNSCGILEHEQKNIFKLLAAILFLGNLNIDDSGEIINKKELGYCSHLLGISQDKLHEKLTKKIIHPASEGDVEITLSKEVFNFSRDTFVKDLYVKLFDWIVNRINQSLDPDAKGLKTKNENENENEIENDNQNQNNLYIGILDIYGFENFDKKNSFEQFSINYANEKLQRHFNKEIFEQEQQIYNREGITSKKIQFVDNQDSLDIVEDKHTGLISLLEEESKIPGGSDVGFCEKFHSIHSSSPRILDPKKVAAKVRAKENEVFCFRHFAGDTIYSVDGFIIKNNDTIHEELFSLLINSTNEFIKNLNNSNSVDSNSNSRQHNSVLGKFKNQLNILEEKLESANSNFIRCINPNSKQSANMFDSGSVMDQLRLSGMMDTLKLMHSGFPTRCSYETLYQSYAELMPLDISSLDGRTFCEVLFTALGIGLDEYQLGITRAFFRAGRLAFVDTLQSNYEEISPDIQLKVKRFLVRKRWRKCWAVVRSYNLLISRWKGIKAGRKLASTSVTVFLIHMSWIRLARRVRMNIAARKIQAVWRGVLVRDEIFLWHAAATMIQAVYIGYRVRKELDISLGVGIESEEKDNLNDTLPLREKSNRSPTLSPGQSKPKSLESRTATEIPELGSDVLGVPITKHGNRFPISNSDSVTLSRKEFDALNSKIEALSVRLSREVASRLELSSEIRQLEEALISANIIQKFSFSRDGSRQGTPLRRGSDVKGNKLPPVKSVSLIRRNSESFKAQFKRKTAAKRSISISQGRILGKSDGSKLNASVVSSSKVQLTDQVKRITAVGSNPVDMLNLLGKSKSSVVPKPSRAPVVHHESFDRLATTMEDIKDHFEGHSKEKQRSLGDDSKNHVVNMLVRAQLAPAIQGVLLHGFKSFRLIGRYSLWDFFLDLLDKVKRNDSPAKLSLCKGILTIKKINGFSGNPDARFRALLCWALNKGILHEFFDEALTALEPRVVVWYEQYSFLRVEAARNQLVEMLRPLCWYPFNLSLTFELSNWDI